jgi:hypothetical protein
MDMYLKEYFKALIHDWIAIMSGIASIILAFWVAYFPPTTAAAGRTLLWLTAVICFVLSSYRIWLKEHKEVLAQAAELQAKSERVSQEVLLKLSEFSSEGGRILNAVANSHVTKPYKDQSDVWIEEVVKYLEAKDLKSYAIRFNSEAVTYRFQGVHTANTKPLLDFITTRLMRLEDFIRELSK